MDNPGNTFSPADFARMLAAATPEQLAVAMSAAKTRASRLKAEEREKREAYRAAVDHLNGSLALSVDGPILDAVDAARELAAEHGKPDPLPEGGRVTISFVVEYTDNGEREVFVHRGPLKPAHRGGGGGGGQANVANWYPFVAILAIHATPAGTGTKGLREAAEALDTDPTGYIDTDQWNACRARIRDKSDSAMGTDSHKLRHWLGIANRPGTKDNPCFVAWAAREGNLDALLAVCSK